MSVIVVVVTGVGMFFLSMWVISTQGTSWNPLAWIVTVIVALAVLVVNAAAITTVYNPPTEKQKATGA